VAFVAETGVDALAVAVGSKHAMRDRTARLDLDLIADLRARLAVPLVLHGSSGVPDEQLRAAVAAGMTKINIGTAPEHRHDPIRARVPGRGRHGCRPAAVSGAGAAGDAPGRRAPP
jgi:fructose-bisphosphate aldolase class II